MTDHELVITEPEPVIEKLTGLKLYNAFKKALPKGLTREEVSQKWIDFIRLQEGRRDLSKILLPVVHADITDRSLNLGGDLLLRGCDRFLRLQDIGFL